MASPFPGMDPFLENSEIWPGFHASLATNIKLTLNRRIGPKYYADVEVQSTLNGVDIETGDGNPIRPDVSIFEPLDIPEAPLSSGGAAIAELAPLVRLVSVNERQYRVRIYLTKTSQLVTSIEILSPANKRPYSHGLNQYRNKRVQLLQSHVHLVELDLLRSGVRPGPEVHDDPIDADYIVLVNRAQLVRRSEIWPVDVDKPLPIIPIPLLPPDRDETLDLNAAIREVYTESGYDWRIDYKKPVPHPPLRDAMKPTVQQWVATRLTK